MAARIVILDDLHLAEGKEVTAAQSVTVGLNGQWWELDVTEEHAKAVSANLEPLLRAGRKLDEAPQTPRKHSTWSEKKTREQLHRWLIERGELEKYRGPAGRIRVPDEIRAEFEASREERA